MSELKVPDFNDASDEDVKKENGAKEKNTKSAKGDRNKNKPNNKEGIKNLKPQDSEDFAGAHKGKGYVTESGVLFPVGFKFKGGHISSKGNVVLNVCPKCNNHQYPSQAVKGFCEKMHEKRGCGFDMISELENYQL